MGSIGVRELEFELFLKFPQAPRFRGRAALDWPEFAREADWRPQTKTLDLENPLEFLIGSWPHLAPSHVLRGRDFRKNLIGICIFEVLKRGNMWNFSGHSGPVGVIYET